MYKLLVLILFWGLSFKCLKAQTSEPILRSVDTIYHSDSTSNKNQNTILVTDTIVKKKIKITIDFSDTTKEGHKKISITNDTIIKKRIVPKPKVVSKVDTLQHIVLFNDSIKQNAMVPKIEPLPPIVQLKDSVTKIKKDSTYTIAVKDSLNKLLEEPKLDSQKTFRETWFYNYFLKYDSTANPRFIIRPFFENGIFFFRNDTLKKAYATQSFYYYSLGVQIGHPKKAKIIPFAQLTFSKFITNKIYYTNVVADSGFKMKQIIVGVILPFIKKDDTFYRFKFAYNVTLIKETVYKMDDSQFGVQIGFGIERRFIGNTRMYADYTYVYQKSSFVKNKDFDMTRLAIGLVL